MVSVHCIEKEIFELVIAGFPPELATIRRSLFPEYNLIMQMSETKKFKDRQLSVSTLGKIKIKFEYNKVNVCLIL